MRAVGTGPMASARRAPPMRANGEMAGAAAAAKTRPLLLPRRAHSHIACGLRSGSSSNSSTAVISNNSSVANATSLSHMLQPQRRWQQQQQQHARRVAAAAAGLQPPFGGGSGGSTTSSGSGSMGLFPAGSRQGRVDLPALMVAVDADAYASAPAQLTADVNAAVTAGATAVVLGGGGGGGGGGVGRLYEAALALRDLLRGRAALLLLDRTDIATAVEADGVVLSPGGVPVVVARRMLAGGGALIGQVAGDAAVAAAAAADGANFVLLRGAGGALPTSDEVAAAKRAQRSGSAIPVIAEAAGAPGGGAAALARAADGFGVPLGELPAAAAGAVAAGAPAPPAGIEAAVGTLLRALTEARAAEGAAGAAAATAVAANNTAASQPPATPAEAWSSSGSRGSGPSTSSSSGGAAATTAPATTTPPAAAPASAGSTLRRLLSGGRAADVEALVDEERAALGRVLALLADVAPGMAEVGLLRDAVTGLDEAFLVVVVGEFNSGKSTVINALLGERFLADGVLPTTNEISVLKYAGDGAGSGSSGSTATATAEPERERDGLFVRRLPAELLKGMSIVDTPGTNVIVERQQRLTEEFVPRADMVLFVLSADRPLTESELAFLRYIRQWRKKVVFVVNKVDLLSGEDEVRQLLDFVADNARRLLALESPAVLPVSSRAALRAKLECGSAVTSGALDTAADDLLAEHPAWAASRFAAFERFIYDFLIGGAGREGGDTGGEAEAEAGSGGSSSSNGSSSSSSSNGSSSSSNGSSSSSTSAGGGVGEGLRLKLQTPLYVADALLAAAGRQLAAETTAAEAELAALAAVNAQLDRFADAMAKDGAAQRAAVRDLVAAAVGRAGAFVDETLQLSNLGAAAAYVFGAPGGPAALPVARGFEPRVLAGATDQLAGLAAEHASWLAANCDAQADYYARYLARRRRPARTPDGQQQQQEQQQQDGGGESIDDNDDGGSAGAPATPSSAGAGGAGSGIGGGASLADVKAAAAAAGEGAPASLAAVAAFDAGAARVLLEEEVREAFLGTAGGAAGAQGLGFLAAGVLHRPIEDILALGIAGLASYVSVLNLPLRRGEIKAKVAKVAGNFADDVAGAMEAELQEAVKATRARVLAAAAPLEDAWRGELAALQAAEARRAALADEIAGFERRVANLR